MPLQHSRLMRIGKGLQGNCCPRRGESRVIHRMTLESAMFFGLPLQFPGSRRDMTQRLGNAMTEKANSAGGLPKRVIVMLMCFVSVFICYIDRVNISVAIIPMAEQYHWTGTTKGWVLSSFFIGYLAGMVPAGWLANRYGGRRVMAVALIGWSCFTVLTPVAAGVSLTTLIFVRIAMGLGEAGSFPSAFNLFARWIPLTERSRAAAINNTGIPLGLTQTSIVNALVGLLLGASGIVTRSSTPSKLNACPTLPAAEVVPPFTEPSRAPAIPLPDESSPLPSPLYHAVKPEGAGAQSGKPVAKFTV